MFHKILAQIFLFVLLFFTYMEVQEQKTQVTSGIISQNLPVFPSIQIHLLLSADPQISRDVQRETVNTILQYIRPDLQGKAWEAHCLPCSFLPGSDPAIIIGLAFQPDKGMLAILQKQGNSYVLVDYLDSLHPIAKLNKLTLPDKRDFLVTTEICKDPRAPNEMEQTVAVWSQNNMRLQNLWNDRSFREIKGSLPGQDSSLLPVKWYKLTENTSLTLQSSPQPQICLQREQALYEAPSQGFSFPAPPELQLRSTRTLQEEYSWQEKWQSFILQTGHLKMPDSPAAEEVAILKDLENLPESLIFQGNKFFRIINAQGQIYLVEKKYVQLKN